MAQVTIYLPNGSTKVVGSPDTPVTKSGNGKKPLFGGRRTAIKILDTETGELYKSKAEAGRYLYHLVDGDAKDNFVWYKLLAKFPNRFKEVQE